MSIFFTVLREGIEYGIVLSLIAGVFPLHRKAILSSAAVVFVIAFIASGILFPLSDLTDKLYTAFMFYGFMILLPCALTAGPGIAYPLLAVVLTLFFPAAQLSAFLFDSVELRGGIPIISAAGGGILAAGLFVGTSRMAKKLDMTSYLGESGIFIVLASFCFVFGGASEFDHSSVITTVQRAMTILLSKSVPFFKHMLLLSDGRVVHSPFDGIFSLVILQRFSMAIVALILFIPPVTVFARLLHTPEPDTDRVEKRALKRKLIGSYRGELVRKGIPLLASLVVSLVLLHSANLVIRPDYEPEPVPVVEAGDMIHIPLVDAIGDISDGKMRKYLISYKGQSYRLIVMMRPDGEVAAVLDACEVCPPRGYIQRADHVICKYCNTPIPVQSLGQPGGCNPIPLRYIVEGDILIIKKEDVARAFLESGKETGSILR